MHCDTPKRLPESSCQNCWKNQSLCVCGQIPQVSSRLEFLILQHPQEVRKELGTARLVSLAHPKVTHRIGLSWSSLKGSLKREVDSQRWGVLYLGSLKDTPEKSTSLSHLQGLVVLDGNWKQAKTLFWRNPWLKKLKKVSLAPSDVSQYGSLRRQPRRVCLATIESVALVEKEAGNSPCAEHLTNFFVQFGTAYRLASIPCLNSDK